MPSSSSTQPPVQPWKVADARANKSGQCQTVYWVKPTPSNSSLRSLPASVASTLPPPSIRQYSTVTTYKGEWRGNQRHGYGTLTTRGWIYEGEFEAGKQSGQGQLLLKQTDGSTHRAYSGDWRNGRREGVGVYFYTDGSRYEGQWQGGLRHGNGTLFFPSGETYTGGWDRGQQSGFGSLVRLNGDVYEGSYVRGRREGAGMYYYREREQMFDGEWVDDQPVTGVILAARDFFTQQRQQQADDSTGGAGQSRPVSAGGRFSLSRPTTAAMLEVSRLVMEADGAEQIPPLELVEPDAILAQQLTQIAISRAPLRALTKLPPLLSLYPPATLTLLRSLFDDQLTRNAKQHLHPPPTRLIRCSQVARIIAAKWSSEGRRGRAAQLSDREVDAALAQLSKADGAAGRVECERDGMTEAEAGDTIGWSGAVYVVWLLEQQRRATEAAEREERERQAEQVAQKLSSRREVATAVVEEQKEQFVPGTVVSGGAVEVEDAEDEAMQAAVEDAPVTETSQAALFDAAPGKVVGSE